MKKVSSQTVLDRLRAYAFNSSHFIWMLSDFVFFQSTTGWIFALKKNFGVTLVALEPLPPYSHFLDQDFLDAVTEIHQSFVGPVAFVSVGARFAKILNQAGYYNMKVGKEPWVHLSSFQPTGKKSRGLRAAKNRAIRDGLRIENWTLSDILRDPNLKGQIDHLHHHWSKKSFVTLEGFLLATDPWILIHDRCCFLAFDSSRKIQGVLIATPLSRQINWYFEDLWLGPRPSPGVAELLTLEAFQILKSKGAEKVSLGLIPLIDLGFSEHNACAKKDKPVIFAACTQILSRIVKRFYNADGMIGFRKRFKVAEWSPTFISVKVSGSRVFSSIQWFQVMVALLIAHKPRLNWTLSSASQSVLYRQNTQGKKRQSDSDLKPKRCNERC